MALNVWHICSLQDYDMGEKKSILIRLDLENSEHKQAYEHLHNKSRIEYKSNSDLIAKAVNAYFNKNNSDIEQIIKRCFAEVISGMEIVGKKASFVSDSENVSWDFIGGDKPDVDNDLIAEIYQNNKQPAK